MLITGVIGGFVNFLLPANSTDEGKFINPWWRCVVLGVGATMLVPLFLEIAQSKLMENVRFEASWVNKGKVPPSNNVVAIPDTVRIAYTVDTAKKKVIRTDTTSSKAAKPDSTQASSPSANDSSSGKNYLLFAAYCLLASAAGFKFINMLINNVVKDKELNQKNAKIETLEKEQMKRTKNAQISQQSEEQKVRTSIASDQLRSFQTEVANNPATPMHVMTSPIPILPPILHPDDPQKGRFGGKPEKNNRKLTAKVTESALPEYYNVEIVVESTDATSPLNTDVIFYLHDSFSPSVYTIKPDEFTNGKAIDNQILSYGAFTVGVITDNGKTMLELDLSEDKKFPKEFRAR